MSPGTAILAFVVVAFAWNLGVHYTGAVMGMPFAAGAIRLWPALALIAVFVVLGATFASGRVQETVGLHILPPGRVTVPSAIVIVAAGGTLTALFNWRRIPTSTIQILVFCVVGAGLGAGLPVAWDTIWRLALVWVCAPPVAFGLGFLLTRLLDLLVPPAQARSATESLLASRDRRGPVGRAGMAMAAAPTRAARLLPPLLVAVGIAAAFVMGGNDVSNATGALIMVQLLPVTLAGLIGGLAMAVGVLTWGPRILRTVAFDVVTMDLTMASAAQGVQALVVLAAVTQGFFTSMNQALVGAMAGAGLARGRQTIHRRQLLGILRGWAIGPLSGFALAYAGEMVARLVVR
jgi:PiT family inorganic phosphate transporter